MTKLSGDSILVNGEINRVLFSEIEKTNTTILPMESLGFSFGFGSAGKCPGEVYHNMGELLTLPGKSLYLPAKRKARAQYYDEIPGKLVTPFNVKLRNLTTVQWKTQDFQGNTVETGKLIEDWVGTTDPGGNYPVYGFVYQCKIEKLSGAWVIKIPSKSTKPAKNRKISDSDNVKDYFNFSAGKIEKDSWAIVVGVVLDSESKVLPKLKGRERLIFYNNPGDKQRSSRYKIHEHGVIYKNTNNIVIDSLEDVPASIKENNFVDVKHILDDTTVSNVSGVLKGYKRIESINGESLC